MASRNFDVLHSDGRPICIVGNTYVNHMVFEILGRRQKVLNLTWETCQQQPQSFFQDHQFFTTSSTLHFKQKVVKWLEHQRASFVSFVGTSSVIDDDVKIGFNTVIQDNNSFMPKVTIGNHCHIVSFTSIVHDTSIADFCYICGYCYLRFTDLGEGTVVGLRSSFVPKPPLRLSIPGYSNFLLNSSVNRSIDTTGTYFGNRKINDSTSLDYSIL